MPSVTEDSAQSTISIEKEITGNGSTIKKPSIPKGYKKETYDHRKRTKYKLSSVTYL